jgi:hypothetical protein
MLLFYTKPKTPFNVNNNSSPPDYSKNFCWAALPQKKDMADITPKNIPLPENQDSALADVFFIHGTTYKRKKWNAGINYKRTNKKTDKRSIKHQASVFNASCKVYAPRYRQATLYALLDTSEDAKKAGEIAYIDIKSSFNYYLKNYNNGRPFIIAGHSQGSAIATRLINDFFNDSLLVKQLVAAYLVGFPVLTDTFKLIKPCGSPTETGCFVSWNTLGINNFPKNRNRVQKLKARQYEHFLNKSTCINPLSWKSDTILISEKENKGSLPVTFKKVHPQVTDAQCKDGILWIHKTRRKFWFPPFKNENYHPLDYNLFYVNIRENIKMRVESYVNKK